MKAGVVIAGGGLAAQRCVETLRRTGYDGPIRMLCAEPALPYDRPPLSKAVLHSADAERTIGFRPAAWYSEHDVDPLLGVAATGLDARRRRVALGDGGSIRYKRLLIATGSRPRRPALLDGFANVSSLRTVEDARALRAALGRGGPLVIVGAGFIGQEVAVAARKAGVATMIVEATAASLQALLGPSIGAWFADLHRGHGVDLVLGQEVVAARGGDRVQSLTLSDGRALECDHVVVGIGVEPDVAWVAGSGLHPVGVRADARRAHRHPGRVRRRRRGGDLRRSAGPARRGGALGIGRPPGRGRGQGDARPAVAASARGELLERPLRHARAVRRARAAGRRRDDRRRSRRPRLLRDLHPGGRRRRGAARRPPPRPAAGPRPAGALSKGDPMPYTFTIDPLACSAHGDCEAIAPEVFRVDDVAVVVGAGADELALEAARACPSVAIAVTDARTGERVFP
jgi:ferredoxin